MRRYAYLTFDVFTRVRFGGNPLAVVLDAQGLSSEEMQTLAREFNYSETVFLLPPQDPRHLRRARIFTPGQELPFAGHPTVGAALALAEEGEIDLAGGRATVVLEEGVGPVPVAVDRTAEGELRAELTAAQPPRRLDGAAPAAALARMASLSLEDLAPGAEPEIWSCGTPFTFLEVRDRAALARARLDTGAWRAEVAGGASDALFLFAREAEAPGYDLRARMFAPGFGVPEDPATGSAAAAITGPWGRGRADGEHRFAIEQGYEMGRPCQLHATAIVRGGATVEARVAGHAVRFATGHLRV